MSRNIHKFQGFFQILTDSTLNHLD